MPSDRIGIGAKRTLDLFPLCGMYYAWLIAELTVAFDECNNCIHAGAHLKISENKWAFAAHFSRISIHDVQRRPHHGGEIDFVNNQQVGTRNAGPTLARNFVARGDVDHVQGKIRELRTEGGGQIIAAAFHEDDIEFRKRFIQTRNGFQINGRILAYRRMRTATGLDPEYAIRRQRSCGNFWASRTIRFSSSGVILFLPPPPP